MNQDVAVIGGSAAGLLTASLLAEKGLNVRVFEASKGLAEPTRTLIVTHQLSELIGPLNKDIVLNEIHRFELFANGRVAEISLSKPDLVIERSRLLDDLTERATRNGAHILEDHRFLDLRPNGSQLKFRVTRNGFSNAKEMSAKVLVGADGVSSKVAELGGWPRQKTVGLIQAVVKLPADMPSDTTRVWFLPENTPYFYWLIPHSSSEGVLGLISDNLPRGRASLERFMKRKELKPYSFQSAPTPIYNRWIPFHRRIGNNDLYLVGDAAGHVKPSTVGGVVTGLRGAFGVAEAVLSGEPGRILRSLRWELESHALVRNFLNGFTQDDYVTLFNMLNSVSTRLLSVYNRDKAIKLLLHLLIKQPHLLLLAIRTIF
jgi:flavin-dependent dehydrogenase